MTEEARTAEPLPAEDALDVDAFGLSDDPIWGDLYRELIRDRFASFAMVIINHRPVIEDRLTARYLADAARSLPVTEREWTATQHREDALVVMAAMKDLADRRARGSHMVPIEDASDLLMALHRAGIYRPVTERPEAGLPCQHEACTEVFDSDTEHSEPIVALAWVLAELSADGPHGSNERRRFRPLARNFLQHAKRDPRRAAAIRLALATSDPSTPRDQWTKAAHLFHAGPVPDICADCGIGLRDPIHVRWSVPDPSTPPETEK